MQNMSLQIRPVKSIMKDLNKVCDEFFELAHYYQAGTIKNQPENTKLNEEKKKYESLRNEAQQWLEAHNYEPEYIRNNEQLYENSPDQPSTWYGRANSLLNALYNANGEVYWAKQIGVHHDPQDSI